MNVKTQVECICYKQNLSTYNEFHPNFGHPVATKKVQMQYPEILEIHSMYLQTQVQNQILLNTTFLTNSRTLPVSDLWRCTKYLTGSLLQEETLFVQFQLIGG